MELIAGAGALLFGTAAADAGAVAGTTGLIGAGGALGGGAITAGGALAAGSAALGVASGIRTLMGPGKLTMPSSTPTAQENALMAAGTNTRQRGYASTILGRDFLAPGNTALKSTLGS